MKKRTFFASLVALMLVLAACGGDSASDTTAGAVGADTTEAVTETTEAMTETTEAMTETTEATTADVGGADNPIQVLFVPSVSADEIVAGGDLLAAALSDATGLTFEVSVPSSYAATIEEICANPAASMGFIPAQAYVLASELCGVDIQLKAERFGYTEYWAQYLVPRDSEAASLEDLSGLSWAYPDPGSTSGFLVPSGELTNLGIEVGEEFEAGSHDGAVRAVYNGEAEFGTSFYSPFTDVDRVSAWDGDPANADIPDDVVDSCALNDDGEIQCGDFVVQDARRNLREELPDVVQQVKILAVSAPIPNDGVAFGPEFPEDLKAQIVDALAAFAADDPEGFATAFDAYSWDNVAPTTDADFDSIRAIVQALGIELGDIG
jgi:phosphonate transport system substrate-binding protein